jgi:hypothetical protein
MKAAGGPERRRAFLVVRQLFPAHLKVGEQTTSRFPDGGMKVHWKSAHPSEVSGQLRAPERLPSLATGRGTRAMTFGEFHGF